MKISMFPLPEKIRHSCPSIKPGNKRYTYTCPQCETNTLYITDVWQFLNIEEKGEYISHVTFRKSIIGDLAKIYPKANFQIRTCPSCKHVFGFIFKDMSMQAKDILYCLDGIDIEKSLNETKETCPF